MLRLFIITLDLLFFTSFFVQNQYLSNFAIFYSGFFFTIKIYGVLFMSEDEMYTLTSTVPKWYKIYNKITDMILFLLCAFFGNYALAAATILYITKFDSYEKTN